MTGAGGDGVELDGATRPAGAGTATGRPGPADAGLPGWVREILRCPVTGATLTDGVGPGGEPELHSTDPERPLAYPVRDGIPVLLESDARSL